MGKRLGGSGKGEIYRWQWGRDFMKFFFLFLPVLEKNSVKGGKKENNPKKKNQLWLPFSLLLYQCWLLVQYRKVRKGGGDKSPVRVLFDGFFFPLVMD